MGLKIIPRKKRRVLDELLEHEATESEDRPDVPPEDLTKNGSEESECNCCRKHSPPKPKLKTMPCGHKRGGRNLIVCIDGTANQFGDKNTNVIELYNLILKETGDNQRTWYNSGIGTYAKPRWRSITYWQQVLCHLIDMAIAWCAQIGLEYDGYILNYWIGCREFERTVIRDTVSSIGVARGKKMLPGTTDGMEHVCHFRHALALDERRVKFLPEYAWGGSTMPPSQPSDWNHTPPRPGLQKTSGDIYTHILEVWFAGTHSDIGGGNVQNLGMDRSRPPLRWMVLEAVALGLRTAEFERELTSDQQIEFQESLTGIWHLLEYWPHRRLTFHRDPAGKMITRSPHRGHRRTIHWGQKIHSSLVLAETPLPYYPKARPPAGRDIDGRLIPVNEPEPFWDGLRKDGLSNSSGWLEIDIYEYARTVLKRLTNGRAVEGALNEIVTKYPQDGPQAVYDESIEVIRLWNQNSPALEAKRRLLSTMIEILECHLKNLKHRKWRKHRNPFSEGLCSGSGDHWQGHEWDARTVAIFPDGKRVVSGSSDTTIRIWDMETGAQVGEPLEGHTGDINLVVISPDGKRIVSGSDDGTIRIWDPEKPTHVGEPLRGHGGLVATVAMSLDGKFIVSGSTDKTIMIWDAEMGAKVGEPLRGHTDCVQSVAISPDGRWIVSGSDDQTVRIWDAETRTQEGEPLQRHTASVPIVSISPDGRHVVSGSRDQTIQIWDLETGAPIGEPLQGHTDWLHSIAISPDGKYFISSSSDRTIRIWALETGAQVVEPLRGHTGRVWFVAISPDRKRIVSGSADRTIRIWNAEGILV
ncbi:hypothetical protein H1R20_g558, partial [Candolleomyces eurysporus]